MTDTCEFATVDSEEEDIVHLGNVDPEAFLDDDDALTIRWLNGILGLADGDILKALARRNNIPILHALYEAKRAEWGGHFFVPAEAGEDPIHWGGPWKKVELAPASVVGSPSLLQHFLDQAQWSMNDYHSGWELPGMDLYLPKGLSLSLQLGDLITRGPTRKRCLTVRPFVFPFQIKTITRLTRDLQLQLDAVERKTAVFLARAAALDQADAIARLMARHWIHNVRDPKKQVAMENLRLALAEAAPHAQEAAITHHEEAFTKTGTRDAKKILELLSSRDLGESLQKIAEQPNVVGQDAAESIADALEAALLQLLRSPLRDEVAHEHILPVMALLCEQVHPGFERDLEVVTDARFANELREGWRETIDLVYQARGKPTFTSAVFAYAKGAARAGGRVRRLILATMHHGVIAYIFDAVVDRAGLGRLKVPGGSMTVGQKMSTLLLRFWASHAVAHRAAAHGLHLDGIEVRGMLSVYQGIWDPKFLAGDRPRVHAAIEQFKNLELDSKLARSRGAIGLQGLAAAAAMFSAIDDDRATSEVRCLQIAAALADLGSTATRALELRALMQGLESRMKTFEKASKYLGRFAVALSLVAIGVRVAHDWRGKDTDLLFVDLLAGTGYALTAVSWIKLVPHAAWFGVVGAGLLVGSLLIELALKPSGTEQQCERYARFATDPSGPLGDERGTVLAARILAALQAAKSQKAFDKIKGTEGDPEADPGVNEQPTWWTAFRLGLTGREIAAIFGVGERVIDDAGIPVAAGRRLR
jgi:hypothetical protein